jgi:hypothetical protein
MGVGISTSPAINHSLTPPVGILDYISSGAGGTSVSSACAAIAGSYTIYGWAQAANGRYYPAGSAFVVITGNGGNGGIAWISINGVWVSATPYICLGGTSWVVATPYICTGGTTWVPTT